MHYIIWALVGAFYLIFGFWGRKQHKKLDDKLKKDAKTVEFIEYFVFGFWPLPILFSVFVFMFMAIKFIF